MILWGEKEGDRSHVFLHCDPTCLTTTLDPIPHHPLKFVVELHHSSFKPDSSSTALLASLSAVSTTLEGAGWTVWIAIMQLGNFRLINKPKLPPCPSTATSNSESVVYGSGGSGLPSCSVECWNWFSDECIDKQWSGSVRHPPRLQRSGRLLQAKTIDPTTGPCCSVVGTMMLPHCGIPHVRTYCSCCDSLFRTLNSPQQSEKTNLIIS